MTANQRNIICSLAVLLLPVSVGLISAQVKYSSSVEESEMSFEFRDADLEGSISLSFFEAGIWPYQDKQFIQLHLDDAYVPGRSGIPELPVLSKLFEIPYDQEYQLEWEILDSMVINLDEDFPGKPIKPSQPSARKNHHPETGFDPGYLADPDFAAGTPLPLISLEYEGKMRGLSLGRIEFRPFRYDQETNSLTFFYNARFRIHFPGAGVEVEEPISDQAFERVFRKVVRKPRLSELKRIVSEEPITMVILSDTLFQEALQPLISWKKQKGIKIIEAYTTDPAVGDTYGSIREYMSSLYHEPPQGFSAPSYLLIVGDVEHVPVSQPSGQVTDLYYTTFDGPDDYLPEMFHGRISVKNPLELSRAVEKTLMYEKYEFPDPEFLDRTILIAGYDAVYAPVHGNGQINYASAYYFNEDNGIDANVYLHPGAADLDLTILDDISDGAALVNYTGHGEYYGWLDPAFRLHHVDTLKNINKFGLMIGNGCSTNQFHLSSGDCFAEALVKAENKGAVGYIGCTNDSYWDEDYYWSVGIGPFTSSPTYEETTTGFYDKLFHNGQENVEEWAPSMGEMIFAGNMTVQESTSFRKKYYWEIYQLMGDPSLIPWFTNPVNIPVEYPGRIPNDANSISIAASAYDYVAISSNGELVAAKHADRFGQVEFHLPDSLNGEPLIIVITGEYRQPFIDTIFRGGSRTGYLEIQSHELKNESVKEDEKITPGEQFSLNMMLVNQGTQRFPGGEIKLTCADSFIEIADSIATVPSIDPGDSAYLENAFDIQLASNVGDKETFTLRMDRAGGYDHNILFLKEKVYTPELKSGGLTWEDRSDGNGNGIMETGEKIRFSWLLSNAGSYPSDSVQLVHGSTLDSLFSNVKFKKELPVSEGDSRAYTFTGELKNSLGVGQQYSLPLEVSDGWCSTRDSISLIIGRHFEDFTTGDLSRYDWVNSNPGWFPDPDFYSGAPYAFRSGNISHNASSSIQFELMVRQNDSVCFDYSVSSESGYDYLRFFVDGELVERWSGEVSWSQFCHPLDSGFRQLEWLYEKDQNTDRGRDAAWIDNIIFPLHAFDSLDIGIGRLIAPVDNKTLSANEGVSVEAINAGKDTIRGFNVEYRIEDNNWVGVTVEDTLLPGQRKEIAFEETADLSSIGDYTVYVRVNTENDSYPGNDSVVFHVSHYLFPDLALTLQSLDSVPATYSDAVIRVDNLGNDAVSSFSYEIYIDDQYSRTDTVVEYIGKGGNIEIAARLLDNEENQADAGLHQFSIELASDSVLSNNSVSGEVSWTVMSIDQDQYPGLNIFPNPAAGYFSIEIGNPGQEPCLVEFINVSGEVVYSEMLFLNEQRFNARDVFGLEGVYFVKVSDSNRGMIAHGKILVTSFQ